MPTITIDLTDVQAQRVRDAFEFASGQPETVATVRAFLVAKLVQRVQGIEVEIATETAKTGVVPIDVV